VAPVRPTELDTLLRLVLIARHRATSARAASIRPPGAAIASTAASKWIPPRAPVDSETGKVFRQT
jgi:hypothetical protein